MTVPKSFSQFTLCDLAMAISATAHTANARALDPATADRLLPPLRNAALTEAVLLRHPLIRDRSGLKCDGSASSKRAWCDMLRDLFDAAGVAVSDAALLRAYLVCKECAIGRMDCMISEVHTPAAAPSASGRPTCAVAKQGVALTASPAPASATVHRNMAPSLVQSSPSSTQGPGPTFEYHDRFLGKAVCIPVVRRIHIDAPLKLIQPALRFHLQCGPGARLPQRLPLVNYEQITIWPAQRVRVMFGFTGVACRRLSTALASLNVYFRTASGWKARVFAHVLTGYVSRLQVRLLLCKIVR
jgi:hypothetical protein